MDLRKVKEKISKNEKFYVPKLNEIVTLREIKEEKGRKWGIGITDEGKDITVDIRFIEEENKEVKTKPGESFSDKQIAWAKANQLAEEKQKALEEGRNFDEKKFLESFDAKSFLEEKEREYLEAIRFLGRKSKYIKRVLKPEMKNAMKKTMMVKIGHSEGTDATVRTKHYANTFLIAYNIAKGIFPGDEDLARGIAIMALGHDYRQFPVGHDGEKAAQKALKYYNAGSVSHGTEGALTYDFRLRNQFEYAINEEEIYEKEAKKILEERKKELTVEEYQKELEREKETLRQDTQLGLREDLKVKIKKSKKENSELTEKAIQLMILGAGNHNGERGFANIEPDYSRTFDKFLKISEESYCTEKADKKLHPHTIADAIVKLSDQISSVPFDMIDGARSELEDEISVRWIQPVSRILQIPEKEVQDKFKKINFEKLPEEEQKKIKYERNRQLKTLALELQDKLVESVIRSSNSRCINMDLADWFYGTDEKEGLRKPNMEEHILYTATKEEAVILDNLFAGLTEKLSKEILDQKGDFPEKLNAVFRLSRKDNRRKAYELELKEKFSGNEILRDFYNYCVETTSEEYNFNKRIIKNQKIKYLRNIIAEGVEEVKNNPYSKEPDEEKGSMEYAIKFALKNGVEIENPENNNEISDKYIEKMIERINNYLGAKPVDGINKIRVMAEDVRYEANNVKYIKLRPITHDQAIAARMAVNYLGQLNDVNFLKLGEELGIITKEEADIYRVPYSQKSPKKEGNRHISDSAAAAMKDYIDSGEEEGR